MVSRFTVRWPPPKRIEKRAAIFKKLAQNEERHAQRWARLIQSAGGIGAELPSQPAGARCWDGWRVASVRSGGSDHQQLRSA